MIINHNCCIKLVPLVIFIYDAWSHIQQESEFTSTAIRYVHFLICSSLYWHTRVGCVLHFHIKTCTKNTIQLCLRKQSFGKCEVTETHVSLELLHSCTSSTVSQSKKHNVLRTRSVVILKCEGTESNYTASSHKSNQEHLFLFDPNATCLPTISPEGENKFSSQKTVLFSPVWNNVCCIWTLLPHWGSCCRICPSI